MARSTNPNFASVSGIADAEFDQRVQRVQRALTSAGLSGLIAYSAHRDYYPGDLRYLSNWACLEEESACLYIPGEGSTTFITNASWELRRAKSEAHASEVAYAGEFADALKDLLATHVRPGDRIGVSGWSIFPAPTYIALRRSFPEIIFEDQSRLLADIRMIKSESELRIVRAACQLTDAAMEAGLAATRVGETEIAVAAAAENVIRSAGAELSFITEIGSGLRTAAGICLPTDRKLQPGDIVTVDVGAMIHGYHGDMARALVLGGPNDEQKRLLEAVDVSNHQAVEAARPGLTVRELNEVARKAVVDKGLGEYWSGDFMPHGLGNAQHEPPEGPKHFDVVLQAGMVLAIEPVVVQPGVGGVIAEHMVIITDGRAEELSRIPTDVWRRM
jgi:Xaa-Pro aminopeptidase